MKKPTEKPLTISVPEAGARLGISRYSAYKAAARGEIPTIRLGCLLRVPLPAFEQMLQTGNKPPKSFEAEEIELPDRKRIERRGKIESAEPVV